MPIGIGINNNVILEKVEITEATKGTMAFTWKTANDEAKVVDPMAALAEDGYTDTGGNELTLRLFSPLAPFDKTSDGTPIPVEEQQKQATTSIAEKKNILYQILSTYMTSDKIKFDPYKGMGMTLENFSTRIVQETTLQKIMANFANDFVRMITPFVGKQENQVRLMLVRQSKTKHFADFRQRFVKDNPFIEPMSIPAEASKLKWSKYELTNKLNDDTVIDKNEADMKADLATQQDADEVFGRAPVEQDPTTVFSASTTEPVTEEATT